MSYILDALKKAEAERQLGAVPGLHAQPSPLPGPSGASATKKIWLISAGAAVAAAAALLVWRAPWHSPDGNAVAPIAQAPVTPPAPEQDRPAPVQSMKEDAPNRAEIRKREPEADVKPAHQDAPPVTPRKPKQPAKTAEQAAPTPTTPATTPAPVAAPPMATMQKPKAPEAPVAVAQPAWGAPAGAPQITISGYVYSDNPNDRQLLANKKLLHEGEEAAPGLVLERMLPKAAVFNYNGTRYQVPY